MVDPKSEAGAVDPSRVQIEAMTTSNRAVEVEFRVRMDTVETWFWEHLVAVFDRERLRAWLAEPSGWIAEGDAVLSVDPRSHGTRVAISLSDVLAWTLSPKEQADLTERV
jgi:hypothetical protein